VFAAACWGRPVAEPAPRIGGRQARSVARLAAVQALYQLEVSGAGVDAVVREFSDHRFGGDIEGEALADADEAYFAEIVQGVVREQGAVDRAVVRRLAANWRLERIDATARAILRCGAWELMHRPDVPTEYVEIAKSFFDGPEPGFVNACLDGLARDERR
jgi:transcription antitermination protein NusB